MRWASERFLSIAIPMNDRQYAMLTDKSVLDAPNMPTGAYTILRNELLAHHIERVVKSASFKPGSDDQVATGSNNPVTRRWRTLNRDFPSVQSLIEGIQPERKAMRTHMDPMAARRIVPADEKSRKACDEATKRAKDRNETIATFAHRLREIDASARFVVEVPQFSKAAIDEMQAQAKELSKLSEETFEERPGLKMLFLGGKKLPYHPDDEEVVIQWNGKKYEYSWPGYVEEGK